MEKGVPPANYFRLEFFVRSSTMKEKDPFLVAYLRSDLEHKGKKVPIQ